MRCDEFETRLQACLDARGRAELDVTLAVHARQCADCQELLAAQQRLWDAFAWEEVPRAAPDFATTVVRQLRSGPQAIPDRSSRQSLVFWTLAVAAGLLVAVLPLIRPRPGASEPVTLGTLAVTQPKGSLPEAAAAVPGAVAVTTSDRSVSDSLVAGITLVAWRRLAPELDAGRRQVGEIASGLRPVAQTLGVALDALRQSIPVGQSRSDDDPQAWSRGVTDGLHAVT